MVKSFLLPTAGLAAALILATVTYGTAANGAAKVKAKKPPALAAGTAALISRGKALAQQDRCTGCHGPDLAGKPGRTPNIHSTGAIHDYTVAQFERLLDTGVKNNGKPLTHMPVYHMKAADSKAIFAYLKTLK